MRRHGELELLLVLPDGSKSLIPAAWTDLDGPAGGADVAATLGSLAQLLALCALAGDLAGREPAVQGQAAGKSPCKEDSHAACPTQSDTRPAADTSRTMVEHLPENAIAAAVALLADVIAKTAAAQMIVVADDE